MRRRATDSAVIVVDSVSVPVALLAGVISFASPCFLPIVPVFLTYLAGGTPAHAVAASVPSLVSAGTPDPDGFIRAPRRRAPSAAGGNGGVRAGVLNAVAFVAAFTVAFLTLWGAFSLVGTSLGQYRAAFRVIGGIALIILGLATLGFFASFSRAGIPRRGPSPLARMDVSGAPTLRRSTLMGLAFAVSWSPCIGPVLGAILGLAIASGTAASGFMLLFVYCLGLGLPLIAMAAGVGGIGGRLSTLTRHHQLFRNLGGAFLIIIGLLLVTDLLAPLSGVLVSGM